TLGFWHREMDKILAKDLGGPNQGFGILGKIRSLGDLPSDKALLGYIKRAAELSTSGTPGRPRPAGKPKPEAKVPPDLAAALKKDRKAAATFDNFSPSHRREYVQWITEAK